MSVTDPDSQQVRLAGGNKFLHVFDIRKVLVFRYCSVAVQTLQFTDFGFDRNTRGMGTADNFVGLANIFIKAVRGAVQHDRRKAAVDRLDAVLESVTMVQMDRDRNAGLFAQGLTDIGEPLHSVIMHISHIHSQHHRRAGLFSRFYAGPDNIVIAALGVDRGDGITFFLGFKRQFFTGYQHIFFSFKTNFYSKLK